jgi:galactose-1-phosphate uridylyltransferase
LIRQPAKSAYASAGSRSIGKSTSRPAFQRHGRLQVFSIRRAPGKLKYLAGSESGAGVWINDVAPERAAELLRAATS